MKITHVDLFQVEIPLIPAIARYTPRIYDITLCRIQTDEGLSGIGEMAVYHLSPEGRAALEQRAASYCGRDPLAMDPFAEPGLYECALLDIAGQAYGMPVWRFFGPKVRDRVPVSYWSVPNEARDTAAEAEVGARLGFANHKLKARAHNIVETVRLMKEAVGPGYTVGVDPNTEFRYLHVASRLAAALEPFGTVAVFEDPMLKDHLEWYRLLREKTPIPVALHFGAAQSQGAWPNRAYDVLAALKAECIDQANLGGRALEVRAAAAVAAAGDVPVWVQLGGVCLGVLAAYSVHLQCTLPNATLPCDELPFVRVADVLGGSLVLDKGHFVVPDGPGLGVTLDMGVVDRYRVA
ncbi:MAG: enolase C-terminal domain-like protein [Candidatus Latescibacterota bacterium]